MFRFVDHTADIAFEVEAENLEELLRDATMAFYSAFAYLERIDEAEELDLSAEDETPDGLLFSWLNELLYIFDTQHFAGKNADISVYEGRTIKAKGKIYGGRLSPEKVKLEPKAITLHNFRVEKTGKGWKASVVIDI